MEDEAALMARVGAGDPEGLGALYDRHHGPLFGFFRRLTGCGAASEDLVHEVFLRVLRYGRTFRPGSPFRPWLYRIARGVHADRARRTVPEDLDETLPSQEPGPHEQLAALQDRERVVQALGSLSPAKRELLLLSRDPELSHQDLADLLGCSVPAVRVRVHRALAELRQAYFERTGDLP